MCIWTYYNEVKSMKETNILEFKEKITKSFLKTVSAFSNYEGGTILFGIDDNGQIKGIEHPESCCLDIENRINDNITPQPNYHLKVDNDKKTISLIVSPGENKPYFYNSKAYKRNDTSTIEVDSFELTRLVLEGKRINYEDLPTSNNDLKFNYLEAKLKEAIDIDTFNNDTLKTLNLFNKNHFNKAAELLSDNNSFPGIDIAIFGKNINIIKKRMSLENMSILQMYDQAIQVYSDYYQYEEIEGSYRKKISLIPEEAFRESIANALIHRAWDLESRIRISMFEDRIEVISPGGLINGITKEEYLSGMISSLRNPIISNVFFRLGIVEIFGTGILRIIHSYENNIKKHIFNTSTNTIQIILPVSSNSILKKDDEIIYNLIKQYGELSTSEILSSVPYSRSKVKDILSRLNEDNIITKTGRGRGTKYHI